MKKTYRRRFFDFPERVAEPKVFIFDATPSRKNWGASFSASRRRRCLSINLCRRECIYVLSVGIGSTCMESVSSLLMYMHNFILLVVTWVDDRGPGPYEVTLASRAKGRARVI